MASPFNRTTNLWVARVLLSVPLASILGVVGLYYYAVPEYTRVGYQPTQPVSFSHKLHAGELGFSCVYCHSHVEESPQSNVPPTQTCMNCHQAVKGTSPLLAQVRESWASGEPIPWNRVHMTPDYVYFNHSIHVRRGVGCVSCHGKVNEMEIVRHDQPLSMSWCLSCHREPEKALRPLSEATNLDWLPPKGETQESIGKRIKTDSGINAPQQCSGCHR